MLDIEGLTIGFDGETPALRDVSLRLEAAERLLVCGAGGSGKSTLLAAAGGVVPRLVRPQAVSGMVTLDGRPLGQWPTAELFQAVGFVFQNLDDQLWNLSVEDLIAFPLENRRTDRNEVRARVAEALSRFALWPLSGRQVLTLSGGERRLVALAAALTARPRLLILDEPTTGLDPGARLRLADALRTAAAGEAPPAVLAADQDAAAFAGSIDRVALLGGGRLSGPAPLVSTDVARWREAGVIAPGEAIRRAGASAGAEVLAVSGIRSRRRRGDGAPVLADVSFRLAAGEVVGLVGANGAGKTTLFQTLLGLLKSAGGTISIAGRTADGWSPAERAREVGYLPQNMRRVLFNMTAIEEIAFAVSADPRKMGDAGVRETAMRGLERYGLGAKAEHNPFALSAREQGLLGLACVECSGCRVAILDEPLLARDRLGRAMLGAFLDAAGTQGRAVILISHDLELVDDVCRRVMVLADGAVAFDGPTDAAWSSGAFASLGWPRPYLRAAHAA